MSIARLVAGVLVATSVTVAAEARATTCVDPAVCFCDSASALASTFSGTIVGATPGADTVSVRLDVVHRVGTETELMAGNVVSMVISADDGVPTLGARIVGVFKDPCKQLPSSCGDDRPSTPAAPRLAQIADAAGAFGCNGTVVSSNADDLA